MYAVPGKVPSDQISQAIAWLRHFTKSCYLLKEHKKQMMEALNNLEASEQEHKKELTRTKEEYLQQSMYCTKIMFVYISMCVHDAEKKEQITS